jgi:hypothetical protein
MNQQQHELFLQNTKCSVSFKSWLLRATVATLIRCQHHPTVSRSRRCAKQCPLASKALELNSYVDDIITGANDLSSAVQVQDKLISLLGKGGFTLYQTKREKVAIFSFQTAHPH